MDRRFAAALFWGAVGVVRAILDFLGLFTAREDASKMLTTLAAMIDSGWTTLVVLALVLIPFGWYAWERLAASGGVKKVGQVGRWRRLIDAALSLRVQLAALAVSIVLLVLAAGVVAWSNSSGPSSGDGLVVEVLELWIGDTRRGSSAVTMNVVVTNRGEPSVGDRFTFSGRYRGKTVSGTLMPFHKGQLNLHSDFGRPTVKLTPDQWLPTVMSNTMRKGDRRQGFVAFALSLPHESLVHGLTDLQFSIRDSYGREHAADMSRLDELSERIY